MTGFGFYREHDGSLPVESAVFQALGAASVCWETPGGAGVFDSTRAAQVGDALLDVVDDVYLEGFSQAFQLIAAAWGGNWDEAPAGWREFAERWRDGVWHPALEASVRRREAAGRPSGAAGGAEFSEPDEPAADVAAAFERGRKGVTGGVPVGIPHRWVRDLVGFWYTTRHEVSTKESARALLRRWYGGGGPGPHPVMVDVVEDAPDGVTHTYWSTHCRHGSHSGCKATTLPGGGLRRPAQCKICAAPCVCDCHNPGGVGSVAAPAPAEGMFDGCVLEQVRFAEVGTPLPRSVDAELDPRFEASVLMPEPEFDVLDPYRVDRPTFERPRPPRFAVVVDVTHPVKGRARLAVPDVQLLPDAWDGSWLRYMLGDGWLAGTRR